jgi:hypothetical protein
MFETPKRNTHRILCDVYYIKNDGDFVEEAVPGYEIGHFRNIQRLLLDDDNFLYIEAGTGGFFVEEEGKFYTDYGSDCRIDLQHVEEIWKNK